MRTDPEYALQLVEKILRNAEVFLSREESDLLLTHKEICTRKLLPVLALEIFQIKEGDPFNCDKLYGSLKLLAGFEENKAFDWMIQLHEFPEELGQKDPFFVLCYWTDLLVATVSSEWYKLKPFIEDMGIDSEIREACIETLVLLVAHGKLDRSLVVEYFNGLYSQAISGELVDPELLLLLLEASLLIWPGDSLEEIRELFGLGLIEEEDLDIVDVLDCLEVGIDECLEDIKEWETHRHLQDFFRLEDDEDGDLEEDSWEWNEEESFYEEAMFEEKSYEKQMFFPNFDIEGLTCREQKKYRTIPKLLLEDSEKALETVAELVADHPDIPILLYSFYHVLMLIRERVVAIAVLKKWIQKFPDDLLGKIEYAQYFLRRGEPDKVRALFSNTWSLNALYPERSSFHEIEYVKFLHLIGCYFLQTEEMEKAQVQAQILDASYPRSFECQHLHKKIANRLQEDSFFENP